MRYKVNGLEYLKELIAVATPDECVLWGRATRQGYGVFYNREDGKVYDAHRLSLEMKVSRKLQRYESACHSCDVRLCVNPYHLWAGSQYDNMIDSMAKGRWQGGKVKRVLSDDEVKEIRVLLLEGIRQADIARRFSVSQGVISNINTNKNYKDIRN